MTGIQFGPWTLARRWGLSIPDSSVDEASERRVAWLPQVDVRESEDRYTLRADLPGVDPKDIEITAEDGVLMLSGERAAPAADQAGNVTHREGVFGRFARRFVLPESANADAITATHTHGVLELVIPKQAKPEARRIQVQAA
jgi:HSP20 family protein